MYDDNSSATGIGRARLGCEVAASHRGSGWVCQRQEPFPTPRGAGFVQGSGKGYTWSLATNVVKRADARYADIQIGLNGMNGMIGEDDL